MNLELGKEKYIVDFNEKQNIMSVNGVNIPVIEKYDYVYKCCKRPFCIYANDGIKGLKKFFEDKTSPCFLWTICRFVLENHK